MQKLTDVLKKLKRVLPDGAIIALAEELGLTRQTVGRVLQGEDRVASEETMRRIEKAATNMIEKNIQQEQAVLKELAA